PPTSSLSWKRSWRHSIPSAWIALRALAQLGLILVKSGNTAAPDLTSACSDGALLICCAVSLTLPPRLFFCGPSRFSRGLWGGRLSPALSPEAIVARTARGPVFLMSPFDIHASYSAFSTLLRGIQPALIIGLILKAASLSLLLRPLSGGMAASSAASFTSVAAA